MTDRLGVKYTMVPETKKSGDYPWVLDDSRRLVAVVYGITKADRARRAKIIVAALNAEDASRV